MGALLYTQLGGTFLTWLLAILLIVVGLLQLTGRSSRLQIKPPWSPVAGAASGLFGGLVGNQGGLRTAGLLSLGLAARPFVATSAAIALMVDLVRVPIYIVSDGATLLAAWRIGLAATIGVVIGTFAGTPVARPPVADDVSACRGYVAHRPWRMVDRSDAIGVHGDPHATPDQDGLAPVGDRRPRGPRCRRLVLRAGDFDADAAWRDGGGRRASCPPGDDSCERAGAPEPGAGHGGDASGVVWSIGPITARRVMPTMAAAIPRSAAGCSRERRTCGSPRRRPSATASSSTSSNTA